MGMMAASGGATGRPVDEPAADGIADPVATRILHGDCGRIVLTVQGASPEHTRMLARVCTAGLEATLLRVYGGRLQRF